MQELELCRARFRCGSLVQPERHMHSYIFVCAISLVIYTCPVVDSREELGWLCRSSLKIPGTSPPLLSSHLFLRRVLRMTD